MLLKKLLDILCKKSVIKDVEKLSNPPHYGK